MSACFHSSPLSCSVSLSFSFHRHAELVHINPLCTIYPNHITRLVVFQNSNRDPPPWNITPEALTPDCSTQTHTDMGMEFTQRNEAVSSYWKTNNNDRRRGGERETHRHRDHPHPFLSPHLVGLDSSLQVLDPFVSLCGWATRKALGSWRRCHLR